MPTISPPSAEGHYPHLDGYEAHAFEDYVVASSNEEQIYPSPNNIGISNTVLYPQSFQTVYTSAGPTSYGVNHATIEQHHSVSPSSSASCHRYSMDKSIYSGQSTSDRLPRSPIYSGASSANYDNSLLSPTPAGYASDNAYSEISEHTMPSFDEDILGPDFGAIPTLDEHNDYNASTRLQSTCSHGQLEYGPLVSHASRQRKRSSQETTNSSHLMSPNLTETSSPSLRGEEFKHLSTGPNPPSGSTLAPNSGPTSGSWSPRIPEPAPTSQNTPALTDSSFDGGIDHQGQTRPSFKSPIVRVENYSRNSSPAREAFTRESLTKKRHRSPGHLSPHPLDDSSENESQGQRHSEHINPMRFPATGKRAENGSWVPSAVTGQAGVEPGVRQHLNDIHVPSLKEQEEYRHIAEKNADVEVWLAHSAPGSEAGDDPMSTTLDRKSRSATNRRRAKSMGDSSAGRADALKFDIGELAFDDSGIPGPGVFVDDESDDNNDYEVDQSQSDDIHSVQSSPAKVNPNQPDMEEPPSYFPTVDEEPSPTQFRHARPWNDPPWSGASDTNAQPLTSNAAIMRFRQRAENLETSSRMATWGTRRLSETDMERFDVLLSFGKDKEKQKDKEKGKASLLDRAATKLLPKRSGSNFKRKPSQSSQQQVSSSESLIEKSKRSMEHSGPRKGSVETLAPPIRKSSFGRQKSLKLNTGGAVAAMAGQMAALGGTGSVSATAIAPPSGPWSQAKNVIKRSRSRSDLSRAPSHSKPGLIDLMAQHGGPPMAVLASPPLQESDPAKPNAVPQADDEEDDDEAEDETINNKAFPMDLRVRADPIKPTYEGFKSNIRHLNPRLVTFLVERISQEQIRRYNKLIGFKVKHLNAVSNRRCSSGKYCYALGGEGKLLPPRASNRDPESSVPGFHVVAGGASDDESNVIGDGAVTAAQFPHGVPLPPVKRLPAEFECPLCFKVKKFQKPSDWTKHVHEDVQPFTCTFANCAEPKSFKRKADWVRHENERHRQLEWWTCNQPDCSHTCYRKDNFVQHLVREHKKPEPKVKATKAAKAAAAFRSNRDPPQGVKFEEWKASIPEPNEPNQGEIDQVWALVEKCRHDTNKQPRDEPCKFCGNICSTWKKLTVHLAKHMEQISMPVLGLVEKKDIMADTAVSPFERPITQQQQQQQQQPSSQTLSGYNSSSYDQPSNPSPNSLDLQALRRLEALGELRSSSGYYTANNPIQKLGSYGAPQSDIYTTQASLQEPEISYRKTAGSDYRATSYPPFQQPRQFVQADTGTDFPLASGSSPYHGNITVGGLAPQPNVGYSSPGTTTPSFEHQISHTSAADSYGLAENLLSGYAQQMSQASIAGFTPGGTSIASYEQQSIFTSPAPVEHNPYAFRPISNSEAQERSLEAPTSMPYDPLVSMAFTPSQSDPDLAYATPQQQQDYSFQ